MWLQNVWDYREEIGKTLGACLHEKLCTWNAAKELSAYGNEEFRSSPQQECDVKSDFGEHILYA